MSIAMCRCTDVANGKNVLIHLDCVSVCRTTRQDTDTDTDTQRMGGTESFTTPPPPPHPRRLFISVQASHCGHATALLAVAVASAFVAFAADCSNEGRHITASIHRSACSLLGKSFLLPVHSGAYTLIAWLVVCSFAEFVTIAKIVYSLCADREWPAIATGRRQHNTAGQ